MDVVITGGGGFLGRRLADALLSRGSLTGRDENPQPIDTITLVDTQATQAPSDPRVRPVVADVSDAAQLARLIDGHTSSVFHLAAVVSGMAEAEFDLGMRINLDATRAVLEACRATKRCPRVVFTSSVAVYGGQLPAVVPDAMALNPQSSYGAQKAIGELLISDYSRKGFVDGRVLRLPTITVRPGRPNAAASSFASGIVREPLNGEEAVCPVDPSTRIWVASPDTAVHSLIHGHELSAEAFGLSRIVNLPGLSVAAAEMVAALERVAGPEVASRVRWHRDDRIERIVASWPGAWDNTRARALGFPSDQSFDAIVRAYVAELHL